MCGIAGCYQRRDGAALARAMTALLGHRGPDGEGIYDYERDGVVASLGHRRLSIIDLSDAAAQPFSKNGLTLVYNGELYNYRELRTELAAHGVTFCSTGDTEVVLEAWRRWGPECLTRFRGMFAFALFDEHTGALTLVRDQLGIKPLYYLHRDGAVVFASELKALTGTLGPELKIDMGSLVASMLYYWVPDQRCSIQGVEKLQPGTWAEFRPDGSARVHQYWCIAEVAAAAAETPAPDLGAVIEDSVAAHLVADVPVSTFLSGGLDSSIVTVLAKRHNPAIDAYTITFRPEDQHREAMPDDAIYARKVASQFGLKLHEIEINPDVSELLPRIVEALDEPIGDPAAINTILICEAARSAGAKVLLSGMGADELFGGYRKHLACVAAARYQRLPKPVRSMVRPTVDRLPVAVGNRGLRPARWAKRFLTFAELAEEPAFRRSYTLYDTQGLARLIGPDLGDYVTEVMEEHRGVYEDTSLPDHVNRMCLADARMFLPGLNLAYTDRASMAASDRGARPVRRRRGGAGRVLDPRRGEGSPPRRKGRPQDGRRAVAAEGDRAPTQGIVRRTDPVVDLTRPARPRQRRPRRRRARAGRPAAARTTRAAHRRRTDRTRRPCQADLAAVEPRALVSARTQARRKELTLA